MMIGERISMLRGDGKKPNTYVIGKVPSRSNPSPRRYIYKVASDKAAYGESFEDPLVNERIRNTSPVELMNFISTFSTIHKRKLTPIKHIAENEYGFTN